MFELPVQAVVDLSAQIEAEFTSGVSWWDWTYSYAMTLSLRDFCPDIDGNAETGIAELLAVLSAWGRTCEPGCPEDFDGSGVVDLGDLLFVLESWGPCATESSPAPTGASDDPVFVRLETLEGLSLFDLSIRCEGDEYFERDDSVLLGPGAYVLEVEADSRRDVAPCGACCLEDGTCLEAMRESDCVSEAGLYQSDGSTCAGACLGACCFEDTSCVDATMGSECVASGGLFRGPGSTCADTCLGACCFPDASCNEATVEGDCVAGGGVFRGGGSTCAADCHSGACCFEDGTCDEVIVEACETTGGLYAGDGSACPEACTVLGPCGWLVDAPLTWQGTTCGAEDSCTLRHNPDVQWLVTIPTDGNWTFSTCGSAANTILYVDTTQCCGDEYMADGNCGDDAELTVPGLTAGQIVYVTLETNFPVCDEFVLVVSSE